MPVFAVRFSNCSQKFGEATAPFSPPGYSLDHSYLLRLVTILVTISPSQMFILTIQGKLNTGN